MRRPLLAVALLGLIAPGCTAAWGERELERDEQFGAHEIPTGSQVLVGPTGSLEWAVLGGPADIAGFSVPAGTTIGFDAEQRPAHFELPAEMGYAGLRIAPGYVELYETGVPRQFSLAERGEYGGYHLEVYGTVELYRDGTLKGASLGLDEEEYLDVGILDSMAPPVDPHGTLFQGWTSFHANGRVAAGFPTRTHVVDGIAYGPHGRLDFHRSGRVATGVLAAGHGPREIDGVPCRPANPVWFHANGRLRYCTLDDMAVLDGDGYPAGLTVAFDEYGDVVEWAPVDSYGSGIELPRGAIRRSHNEEDGWYRLRLRESLTINGYPCQASSDWTEGDLELDEQGNVRWCVLAEDVRINGKIVAAGSQLTFDRGQPLEAYVRRMHTTDSGTCGPEGTLAFDGERVTCGWMHMDE